MLPVYARTFQGIGQTGSCYGLRPFDPRMPWPDQRVQALRPVSLAPACYAPAGWMLYEMGPGS